MAIGIAMFVVGFLVVGVVVIAALRSWGRDEAATEARLHSPGAHTVAYVVPDGQDPAVLMASLTHEGFVSVTDIAGGTERLLVECEESDRGRVRSILEQVERRNFDGSRLPAGHVSFEDER